MEEFTFEITERIGVLKKVPGIGWQRELNKVKWGKADAKYDIRDWSPDHEKMSRGITMTEEEAQALYKLLKERFEG